MIAIWERKLCSSKWQRAHTHTICNFLNSVFCTVLAFASGRKVTLHAHNDSKCQWRQSDVSDLCSESVGKVPSSSLICVFRVTFLSCLVIPRSLFLICSHTAERSCSSVITPLGEKEEDNRYESRLSCEHPDRGFLSIDCLFQNRTQLRTQTC
jgi:hypothetical protein